MEVSSEIPDRSKRESTHCTSQAYSHCFPPRVLVFIYLLDVLSLSLYTFVTRDENTHERKIDRADAHGAVRSPPLFSAHCGLPIPYLHSTAVDWRRQHRHALTYTRTSYKYTLLRYYTLSRARAFPRLEEQPFAVSSSSSGGATFCLSHLFAR